MREGDSEILQKLEQIRAGATGGGAPSGAAGGDLSGTYPNPTVAQIGGSPLGTGVGTFLATPSSANLASAVTGETGTGSLVFATSPTLVTPVLGVATATSINGNTITTGTGVLTLADSKTLTASNTLTLAGTDGTTMTFPSTSATIARTDAANTFTGTQTFGAVVGTTWNGNTWATGTGTLSIAASKTFTSSNTLILAGTDSTTMTFPSTSATIARTDTGQTFAGAQIFSATGSQLLDQNGTWRFKSTATTTRVGLCLAGSAAGEFSQVNWTADTDSNSAVDTSIARVAAGIVGFGTGNTALLTGAAKGTFIAGGTATTCTGATIGSGSKNNAGFVTATTTGTSTIVVTFSFTAPTGWNIVASDSTAASNMVQTASTTTTATLSGTTVSGDVIRYIAIPY